MASRSRRLWPLLVALVCALSFARGAWALGPNEVPEPLKPWVRWVQDTPGTCPVIGEEATCVWPSALQLDLDDSGGRFRMQVTLDRTAAFALPGSATSWPQDVTATGNQVAIVLDQDGTPSVTLPAGTFEVRGLFRWNELPETLTVPPRLALLELRLGGKLVPKPRRDQNRLWLKADPLLEEEPDSLGLVVFRNLEDGVPFKVDTRLLLTASGRAREVLLGNVLLEGTVPIALEAAVPVRLEQGLLYAQVFPGKHEIRFSALMPTPPDRLSRPNLDAIAARVPFWPKREVWVFTPNTQVRQVDLTGSQGIDPAQTELPPPWKQLAAYSVEAGGGLTLETRRRGEADAPPNRVDLQREIWLDLDGNGYTVRDRFSGTMNRAWRLDLLHGTLGRVVVGSTDQLVTKNPVTGNPGVELREGALQVLAEWRHQGPLRALPAVGWSEDVQSLTTQVHVPPGWRLLSASGVDAMSETWLSSWDLFALFFVLVVALSIGKLANPVWGVVALVTLVVIHGEAGAPFVTWLCLVVGIALCRVVPKSWFRTLVVLYAAGAAVALTLGVVSFGVNQVRAALYPQIEETGDWFEPALMVGARSEAAYDSMEGGTGSAAARRDYAKKDVAQESAPVQRQQDPEAVIQTGPGVPNWSWRSWQLLWSGPVHHEHQVEVVLLSPTVSRALFVLRTLLAGLLAVGLLRLALRGFKRPPEPPSAAQVAATAKWFGPSLLLLTLAWPKPAHAELPDATTLDELRQRLNPPPTCAPNCLSTSLLELDANQTEIRLVLDVHAGDKVALQLPGPAQNWLPRIVSVDGARSQSLLLGADGFLYLRLLSGRHRVELQGPVGNDVTLMLGGKPHRVDVKARDFEVEGLSSSGQVDGPLTLRRKQALQQTEDNSVSPAVELPVWATLTRTLDFGVNWTVHTRLERVGPVGTSASIRVPLLPGERVTTQGVAQQGPLATINLGREQTEFVFESTLSPSDQVRLTAASGSNLSERWVLRCSPIWHCETTGIAPTSHQSEGHHQPDFRPWPGEVLEVSLRRPAAEAGRHTTVDAATLAVSPGTRLLHAELTLELRTSTQDTLTIGLPEPSEIQELSVDGAAQPFAKGTPTVGVGVVPGTHTVRVTWQQPGGMQSTFTAPKVTVSGEVVNARVTIHVPEERWLLFARGPSWGPAILFWGHLVLILLVAPLLGRLQMGKLKTWQWATLALGLTQVPIVVAALVVGWFFVFGWAARSRPLRPLAHNFAQLGLAFYTLVFLGCLFAAVYDGLLSTPNMEVVGAGSSDRTLSWYVDRTGGELPTPTVFSTSLWAWRIAMLGWALWLSWNLIRWLRWGFEVFSGDGLWKKTPKRPLPDPGVPPFMPYPSVPGPFPPSTNPAGPMSRPSGSHRVPPPSPHSASPREHAADPSPPVNEHAHHAVTHRDGPEPITEAMVDEKTPIEPLVRMVEERRHAPPSDESPKLEFSTRSDAADLASDAEPTDDPAKPDFEERPTLPRMEERGRFQEPFTFTAFDFRLAEQAIDNIDSEPPPEDRPTEVQLDKTDAEGRSSGGAPEPTSEPSGDPSHEAPPTSRVGTPPPKPPGVSTPPPKPPAAISHPPHSPAHTLVGSPMATPPGGFSVDELSEREPKPETEPPEDEPEGER